MMGTLAVGLLTPVPGMLPDYVPPVILAVMMGFSCSKISVEDLKNIRIRDVLGFYVFRFLALPALLFLGAQTVLPEYSYILLLLTLLPVAVSAAALTAILGGNATLGLSATVLTSFMAPFVIPAVFEFAGYEIALDTFGMFKTLIGIVFVPALIYFLGIRRLPAVKKQVQENASFVAVTLFSVFVLIVVSKLRDPILTDPAALIEPTIILLIVFIGLFLLGWGLFFKSAMAERISYTLFSACMNIGLGVSLVILFFPVQEQVYIIICEFLWVLSLPVFQAFLKRQAKKQAGDTPERLSE